jgi:hypothetical protein
MRGRHQVVDGCTNQLKNLRTGDHSAASTRGKIEAVGDRCEAGHAAGTGYAGEGGFARVTM